MCVWVCGCVGVCANVYVFTTKYIWAAITNGCLKEMQVYLYKGAAHKQLFRTFMLLSRQISIF